MNLLPIFFCLITLASYLYFRLYLYRQIETFPSLRRPSIVILVNNIFALLFHFLFVMVSQPIISYFFLKRSEGQDVTTFFFAETSVAFLFYLFVGYGMLIFVPAKNGLKTAFYSLASVSGLLVFMVCANLFFKQLNSIHDYFLEFITTPFLPLMSLSWQKLSQGGEARFSLIFSLLPVMIFWLGLQCKAWVTERAKIR